MSRTRHLKCPKCGRENSDHWSMICGECDEVMVPIHRNGVNSDMLENLPPARRDGLKKQKGESPTLIFKGSGWTPRGGNNE